MTGAKPIIYVAATPWKEYLGTLRGHVKSNRRRQPYRWHDGPRSAVPGDRPVTLTITRKALYLLHSKVPGMVMVVEGVVFLPSGSM